MVTVETMLADVQAAWDDAAELRRLGLRLHGHNRPAQAERVLRRCLELDPQDERAWEEQAYVAFRRVRDQEGLDLLRRGIEATGSDRLRAVLAGWTPDEEEARGLLEAVADSDDIVVEAQELGRRFWRDEDERGALLARLLALHEAHPEEPALALVLCWTLLGARARGLMPDLDGREQGRSAAEALIRDDPDHPQGYWFMARMAAVAEDAEGAIEAAARGLARIPDEETLMLQRALAHREQGDEARAIRWLERAIGAKPSFVGARVALGRLHEDAGRLVLAEEVFREAPVANPAHAAAGVELAAFLMRRGRGEEAEALFLEAWPRVPRPGRAALAPREDVAALLARPAVAEALATEGAESAGER